MTDETCLFCQIVSGTIPSYKVYEDEDFLAFLDITPVNPGHVLLIPKGHYENLFDLPTEWLAKAGPLIKQLAQSIKASTNADGINLGMNNGTAAGQIINHAHIHIIPRFTNDGFKAWEGQAATNKVLTELALKIKGEL